MKIPVIDMHCDTIALIRSCRVQGENRKTGRGAGVAPSLFFSVSEEELEGGIRLRRNGRHLDAERLKEGGGISASVWAFVPVCARLPPRP